MQITIPVFISRGRGEDNQEPIHKFFLFLLSFVKTIPFCQLKSPNLSIIGLRIDSHLNKTLDITELCLRLAFGLRSDQKVRRRTKAITVVSQPYPTAKVLSGRGCLNNIFTESMLFYPLSD